MYLGVDYYPEQWDRSLIDEDLDNIVELGCNIIRIGDFAWNIMEPEDGKYDFSFFDEVIEKAGKRGLKVMMCVPTATMPRWLNLKYPQIMAEDEHGNVQPYGGRRGYCYNSDIYRRKAMEITRQMAMHYHNNKTIVAWQLDNEIGHEGSDMCYCANCHRQFIQYLKGRYESIDDLNQRWGTNFWAQSYDRFEDIPLPKKAYTSQNPSLRLEWERFRSESIVSFLKMEYNTLKKINPQANILHDFEGGTLEKHFDPFEVSKNLDDVAYNNYPVWGGTVEPMKPWQIALSLDAARGFKGENFWITEEIMGAQGHDTIGCAIKPQQGSVWAMQALAHGCKSFLVFRYRGYTKGAEQYCYGIIDADNRKSRKFREVQQLYKRIRENERIFAGKPKAKCAIVYDYDSAASFRIQRQSDRFSYLGEMEKLYQQLYNRNMLADIITKDRQLDGYQIVIVPYMIVMDDSFKKKLVEYAQKGGTVVLTAATAWKDIDNNLVLGKDLPVDLTKLAGVRVAEHESLLADQYRQVIDASGRIFNGHVLTDMLKTDTAESLMKYHDNAFGPLTAVSVNNYGKGRCFYIGTSLDYDGLNEVFEMITDLKANEDLQKETVVRENGTIRLDYDSFQVELTEN